MEYRSYELLEKNYSMYVLKRQDVLLILLSQLLETQRHNDDTTRLSKWQKYHIHDTNTFKND